VFPVAVDDRAALALVGDLGIRPRHERVGVVAQVVAHGVGDLVQLTVDVHPELGAGLGDLQAEIDLFPLLLVEAHTNSFHSGLALRRLLLVNVSIGVSTSGTLI
jgi:hypothetical protein